MVPTIPQWNLDAAPNAVAPESGVVVFANPCDLLFTNVPTTLLTLQTSMHWLSGSFTVQVAKQVAPTIGAMATYELTVTNNVTVDTTATSWVIALGPIVTATVVALDALSLAVAHSNKSPVARLMPSTGMVVNHE
jgi:hypothetical protein